MGVGQTIQHEGYALLRSVLDPGGLAEWRDAVARFKPAVARNLLADQRIAQLAASAPIRRIVEPLLGKDAQPVRGLLFDKRPSENWGVGWHQDRVIAVQEKTDPAPAGFRAWSMKQGVQHVCPPCDVLEQMLSLRLALDDAGSQNGALRVMPGTHRRGLLGSEKVDGLIDESRSVACETSAGDLLLMKPLLLHASSKSTATDRRRVVHLEFSATPLPAPLCWPRWGRDGDPADNPPVEKG